MSTLGGGTLLLVVGGGSLVSCRRAAPLPELNIADAPVARENRPELSFAPVVKKVSPSVVHSEVMLWMSCFAICISDLLTAFSTGFLNSETSRSSSGKCINSSMSPFFLGLAAARCCRARITTRAMAILPDSIKASSKKHVGFIAALPHLEVIRAYRKEVDQLRPE